MPRPSDRSIVASLETGTSIRSIHTMTLWTTEEILLEVCAGRKRQNQSDDNPVKDGDAPHRFHSLRHQPSPPRKSIKARGTIGKSGSAMIEYVITQPTLRCWCTKAAPFACIFDPTPARSARPVSTRSAAPDCIVDRPSSLIQEGLRRSGDALSRHRG
jgi:hypothetical protein